MHLLSFPNGFEKTECVGKKLKNIAPNVLRIYEVRLNEIINYKQMLVSVSCIYDVSSSNGLI